MKEKLKVIALFPGQGSQQVGMGKAFYESEPLAKEIFERANSVLGFDLSKLCFEGPASELTATAIVQPAILTVSHICYQLFAQRWGDSIEVVALAGHSLGEYSALVSAGAISFEDAVLLVNKRGKYMQEAVPREAGKMLAVLGSDIDELEKEMSAISGVVQIANVNAPGQIVVSGQAKAVDELKARLPKIRMVELAVSAPFHCDLMKPAAEKLALDLDKVEFKDIDTPVYANFSANPLMSADLIRQALKDQVCGRVRWTECIESAILDLQPELAIEFGTGKVLSGLLKRIDPALHCNNISCPDDIEKFVL